MIPDLLDCFVANSLEFVGLLTYRVYKQYSDEGDLAFPWLPECRGSLPHLRVAVARSIGCSGCTEILLGHSDEMVDSLLLCVWIEGKSGLESAAGYGRRAPEAHAYA